MTFRPTCAITCNSTLLSLWIRCSRSRCNRLSSRWLHKVRSAGNVATMKRCAWVSVDDPLMLQYHDREWGVPVHDDRRHFEFLVLEAAQAGLSWSIVLKKR